MENAGYNLLQHIQRRLVSGTMNGSTKKLVPIESVVKSPFFYRKSLFDTDTLVLAQQITLYAFGLFKMMRPPVFWSNKHGESVELKHIADFSTHLSDWTSSAILSQSTALSRAKMMTFFVRIATHCLNVNNFESAMAFALSFNSLPIDRLKHTHDKLDSKCRAQLKALKEFSSTAGDYQTYREAIQKCPQPCIPFLGLALNDLLKIERSSQSSISDGCGRSFINFSKMIDVASVLTKFQLFQNCAYNFPVVTAIQAKFVDFNFFTGEGDSTLLERSFAMEPAESAKLGKKRSFILDLFN